MAHQILAEIASDNSKLFKESILRREAVAGNHDFFTGLRYALDNIDTFGVKKVPIRIGADGLGLPFITFKTLANALIKRAVTGHAALGAIDVAMQKATNAEWNGWYRLILQKDIRAGFSETTVNRAVKDINKEYVIPTTPYMRCSLPESSNMEDWDWSKGVYSNLKADGMFAYINLNADGFVWVTSRGGTLFLDGTLGIEDAAAKTFDKDTCTHGELTVYQDGKLLQRQLGNGILNSVLKGGSLESNQIVVFDCWDQIPLSAFTPKGKYNTTYKSRFDKLSAQVKSGSPQIKLIETRIVTTMEDAQAHYKEMRKLGLEGTICKSPDTIWKDGTSKDQVKFKESIDVELIVKGFAPGKGKNAALFGSLTSQSACGKLECGVSGLSDELRLAIHNDRKNWLGKIITVRSNSVMYSSKGGVHSLFLPRFIEERDDKTEADTFEQIEAQFAAAGELLRPKGRSFLLP